MYHPVVPTPPAFHTVPVGAYGSVLLPRSPCLANRVVLYSPDSTPETGPPPAMPQESKMGARPGARHGLCRVQSSAEPAAALRFPVRYFGSFSVAFAHWPQRQDGPVRRPFPSHVSQPIVHPELNQKQDWPTSHASVPLLHEHPSWQDGGVVPQVSLGSPHRPVPGKSGTVG